MSTENTPMTHADEYRTAIDGLRFSDEAKARMVARLAEAAASADEDAKTADAIPFKAPRKRRFSLAAVAAAIALTFAVGGVAYASGALMSVERFVGHLFGGADARVEIVDKVGRPVGIAQSSNGVTISCDAIVGDKTNIAIVFSISKDDGTAFEGIEPTDNGLLPLGLSSHLDVRLPLFTGYGATGSSYFFDADPSDNAIQLVETRSYESDGDSDISLIGRTMTAHFSDLMLYGEGEPIPIATGSWKLSFPLDYEDASRALPAGQSFDLNGISATIDDLSISPIALHMRYTANQKVEWTSGESGRQSEHDSKLTDSLLGVDVTLNMADGATVEIENLGGGRISEDGDVARCETGIFFDRILDLNEVSSITIGGTTIEL